MKMCNVLLVSASLCAAINATAPAGELVRIDRDNLNDKIRGGFIGQVLGNLNGMPHEMKYIDLPGNVTDYTPGLPHGARTDDDTDLEWVYTTAMAETGELLLSPETITALWKHHINRNIWCANEYARQLMDLGILPPHTGREALNPWSEFNISGQFICESFGLIAPGMPQTASRIGLHYTTVTIDGEPAQTTQLFCTMIASAFFESDPQKLIDVGLAALDPDSRIRPVVEDVRSLHAAHPDEWQKTRHALRDRYSRHGGRTRDSNGYELNTASTIAALLYGNGDFSKTLRTAFNFGWDADNNAATAATIVGVTKGYRWIEAQSWDIKNIYRNITRDNMPDHEPLMALADRLSELALLTIERNGGSVDRETRSPRVTIRRQKPGNVCALVSPEQREHDMREELLPQALTEFKSDDNLARARAAYLLICLGQGEELRNDQPDAWSKAVQSLQQQHRLLHLIRNTPGRLGESLRGRAAAAGLRLDPEP